MTSPSSLLRPFMRWQPSAITQCLRRDAPRRGIAHNVKETAAAFDVQYLDPILRASLTGTPKKTHRKIQIFPAPPSSREVCREPMKTFTAQQLTALDPTGARTRLFSKANPEAAKVGDILLVRQANGEPFAGACMNIRRRGQDTGILLRNQLTRVGVEMWFKVYSPNVSGIEVVQRREKRARRARLYYLRKVKHDMGSVEGVVRGYLRQRALLGAKSARGRDANSDKKKSAK